MNTEEIREIAIDSSSAYYNYLDQNEKGIQEVEVFELEYLESRDLFIKLRLSAKLFDTEALFFKNYRNNKKYDTGQVKVVEYDGDKNILLIKPSIELMDEFQNLKHSDIKVISDLKFLIQRVKTWFELNGADIALPLKTSSLKETFDSIRFIPGKEFQPSLNQKQSLENIFINPFSYVWGAPGTGKTQFVLSYAVLHYISNNKKVAILAPTNNSIEQVLRGVIKMTDKAGSDRTKILRLGTPSKKFAEEFPDVCEEKGVQKNLQEIDKQISILERVISYDNAIEEIKIKEKNLRIFDTLLYAYQKKLKIKDEVDNKINLKKRKEIDIKFKNEEIKKILNDKNIIERKKNSILYTVSKFFSSSSKYEDQLEVVQSKIINAYKDLDFYNYEYESLDRELNAEQVSFEKANSNVLNILSNLKGLFIEYTNYEPQIADLSEKNLEEVKSVIKSLLRKEKEEREIDSHLIQEYKQIPIQQIQYELTKYINLRNKLAAASTEERLKSVQVIACTLDGYIGRYTESKLNVDHIFLDEAGYANIIKTLTIFNHRVPVTLLGDHMQLPPVCEINDSDIKGEAKYKNMFLWAQSAIHLDHIFVRDRDTCLNQYLNNIPFNPIDIKKTSLNATYRFGNNLALILGQHVYNRQFTSLNPIGETQILYIDAKKIEGLKSRISSNEVQAIGKIVENLKRLNQEDFVILTPYKKQIKLLNTQLPKERNDLKILTVHGSQGREWDTVILSVVDTSDKWFVDSTILASKGLNLVNTAVSRAKKQLIIVCDKSYWINQNGQLLTDLIRNGKEIKN
ncbi:AAA domain-containing protein [Larkinella arboricola]|uniref:AAA domain-containing protein n=1 Tax=Larkinella arboricola TaxID=643671 RepID=A0A327XAL2_LARAB|nr:AAA domain-containing protein [Larkinella arboricola]RAK02903.1 AAA domain-containing protein [Larkinella arboricola]